MRFVLSAKFYKNPAHCNFETKSVQVFNFGQDPQFPISYLWLTNDLLWVSNFIASGIYFIFGTKFFWNEGIDTCFYVKCVLFGRNFDFLGVCLAVTACYLVVTACYVVVTGGDYSLLVVTARYRSFPLLVWTEFHSMLLRKTLHKIQDANEITFPLYKLLETWYIKCWSFH